MRRWEFLTGAAAAALQMLTREPSRLRLAALPLAQDIDPYRDAVSGVDELAWLYADGLVGWDGGAIPLLAEHLPEVRDGGRRYLYELRRVRWHDGRPVLARDVAEAFAAVRASAWGTHEPYRSVHGDIVVRDERHFEVLLASPRPGFIRSFFGPYGVPALPILRSIPGGTPIGTGPFAVRERPEPGRWMLERRTESPRGIPMIDLVDVRFLSSEITSAVQIRSGEADIALPLSPDAVKGWPFGRVRRNTSTAVLLINAEGALGTATLRRTFAATIDVPLLQRRYDRTRTELLASLRMSGPNDERYARALAFDPLAGASLRRALDGRALILAAVSLRPPHGRVVAHLVDRFERERIAYQVLEVPPERYTEAAGPLRSGHFDVAMDGFTYAAEPDFASDWSCANRPPIGGNFGRWCDALFDTAVRHGDTAGELRRLYDEMVCIPLSRAYEIIGLGTRVHGFESPLDEIPATYGCAHWYLG